MTAAIGVEWKPMLANSGPATDEAAEHLRRQGYVFDMKWDGVRCIAVVEAGEVKLLNRKGEDFAYRYPEVCAALTTLSFMRDTDFVLDGEIVIFDPATGRPQFGLTGQRAFGPGRVRDIKAASERTPGTFVAFDALAVDGDDIRHFSQRARFDVLDAVVPAGGTGVVRSIRGEDGAAMLKVVRDERLEGVIAKRLDAPYKHGRRSDWIKMKPVRSCTALVTGYEPGEGKRADTFGALLISVLSEAGDMVSIGKVGTGFSDVELATMDPFVKAGQEFMVEIEYLDRQPKTGVLRFPVFKGVRWDLTRADCTEAQLPHIPA